MTKNWAFISYRTLWLTISSTMLVLSLVFFGFWGLNLGIDFTGGSLLQVQFAKSHPSAKELNTSLKTYDLGEINVQPVDNNTLILRFRRVDDATHQKVIKTLTKDFGDEKNKDSVKELRFDSIGSVVGQELKQKAFYALAIVLLVIIVYVAVAFRKVSWPVQSWKYGLVTVIAGFHDVIGVVGLFAFLGHFYNVEINAPFIAALLTVLSYSVNDTIVILDRIRENLNKQELSFAEIVNVSLNETFARSINTTLSTLLTLFAVYFFGGESVRSFVLAMLWGIALGAYSSIFVASPMLVVWYNWDRKRTGK